MAKVLRQIWRTLPTCLVTRHGIVDELRVWQVQVFHQLDEILERAFGADPRVALLLLRDARYPPPLVVMRRVHERLARQAEQQTTHALVQRTRVAALKVRTADTVDTQRVAGEHAVIT